MCQATSIKTITRWLSTASSVSYPTILPIANADSWWNRVLYKRIIQIQRDAREKRRRRNTILLVQSCAMQVLLHGSCHHILIQHIRKKANKMHNKLLVCVYMTWLRTMARRRKVATLKVKRVKAPPFIIFLSLTSGWSFLFLLWFMFSSSLRLLWTCKISLSLVLLLFRSLLLLCNIDLKKELSYLCYLKEPTNTIN